MNEEEITLGLKLSSKHIGRLYPVLLDRYGNIVDGLHRLEADPHWPKMKIDHIKSDEDRIIARLIANVCRRSVPAEEKSEMLKELGELYVKAGIKPGAELANKISEKTGMSYRWVMKYLPDEFKERPGIGGPSKRFNLVKGNLYEGKVARFATFQIEVLLSEPVEKVLTVKKYANVNFVQAMLEKRFYVNLERLAEKLDTTPEVIINNLLVSAVRKLMEISRSNNVLSVIQT
ncbi:MAG: hypothetical protein ACPLRY_00690 [Candidatus Bathyarchaeales archaeon]